jgi:hypothetical protein
MEDNKQQAKLVALWGHWLILEDGPEIIDPESQEEEHGDSISTRIEQPRAQRIEQPWLQVQADSMRRTKWWPCIA